MFRKAAREGHAAAQFNLGTMYARGEGVKQNYDEAAKWWRKAANQGHGQAQFNLGFMYFKGYGGVQNKEEAAKWFIMAAKQGHGGAIEALAELGIEVD